MLERVQPDPFVGLERGGYRAILVDPPWNFTPWSVSGGPRSERRDATRYYDTMSIDEICALPVGDLAARDCMLFLWATWPMIEDAFRVVRAWGFTYSTCGFLWAKAHARQIEMFRDDLDGQVGMGFWTRSNSEPCLLAIRGKPKRLNKDVRQAIIEPRREHSRKPDCVRERIERLVAGPYLELFARSTRPGWDVFGDETGRFAAMEETE